MVRATNEEVTAENRRLQALCTSLHDGHHTMTLRVARLQDAVNSRDTENAELKNQIDDLQYELMKVILCITLDMTSILIKYTSLFRVVVVTSSVLKLINYLSDVQRLCIKYCEETCFVCIF